MNFKDFFGFCLDHWSEILYVFAAFLALFVSLIKKRGKTDPAVEKVLECLPKIICVTEKTYCCEKNGRVKKDFAMMCALDLYEKFTGVHVSKDSDIAKYFSKAIENILSTPQKKGE